MIRTRLNINNIQAVFADIDGTVRHNGRFGRRIPTTTLIARLMLNIPVFPITGRDLNGWKSIRNSRRVFGTRTTSIPLKPNKFNDTFGRRRFCRPETPAEIKKFIKNSGCVVVNNGGTITTLDSKVVFQHYPFTEVEQSSFNSILIKFIDRITAIEISNLPGKNTVVLLPFADDEQIKSVHEVHVGKAEVFSIWDTKRYSFERTPEDLSELIKDYRPSRINISSINIETNKEILEELDLADIECTSNEGSLAITGQKKNKRSGIEWIAKNLGLDLKKCIFIGNDHNDAPALTHPDIGFPIFIGDPKIVSTERMIQKYGKLPKRTIFVNDYNELSDKIAPLLMTKQGI